LKFNKQEARFCLPFYLVCDFESLLSPIQEDIDVVKAIDEHKVCGFACYRVSEYPKYQTEPVVYSGPNVMDKFYEHLLNESKLISEILWAVMHELLSLLQSSADPARLMYLESFTDVLSDCKIQWEYLPRRLHSSGFELPLL